MATKGSHFRLTDEELATMDAIGSTLVPLGVKPPGRTEVFRLLLRDGSAKYLKSARKKSEKKGSSL